MSKYRVKSVDRAIDVLEMIGQSQKGMTLTEIARSLGGAKSAVYATLQTLLGRGLLRTEVIDTETRYFLGLRLTMMGDTAARRAALTKKDMLRQVARLSLEELASKTGLPVRLAVPVDKYAVVIGHIKGRGIQESDYHMNRLEHLHSSSLGKAILAGLPEDTFQALIQYVPLIQRTPKTVVDREQLAAEVEQIRRTQVAFDDEGDYEGVVCIGSAVFNQENRVVAAISVTVIKAELNPQKLRDLAASVKNTAAEISKNLRL